MKNWKPYKIFRYKFDYMMSRGPVAMALLLFFITAVTVGLIGIITYYLDKTHSFADQIWLVLMHTLDTGNLAANATDNIPYVFMMAVATFSGVFITSLLIGLISTDVKGRFDKLAKGTSVIQEKDHTVIIGFDDNIYTLIGQLLQCYEGKKHKRIIILANKPKEEMDSLIASHFPNTGDTRIICRSGVVHEAYAIRRCAVENAHSVIINIHEDSETIKVLLALSAYLRELDEKIKINPNLHFVASVQDPQYEEAARIAGEKNAMGEDRAKIVYTKDAIARIIANTCRHHGLSRVMTELLNFEGNELYFEQVPSMTGKTFGDACLCFSNAVVMGIRRKNTESAALDNGQKKAEYEAILNPPKDTIIGKEDELILCETTKGAYVLTLQPQVDEALIIKEVKKHNRKKNDLLVLGSNDKLPIILSEYDKFVAEKTKVVIVDDDIEKEELKGYRHIEIEFWEENCNKELLEKFVQGTTKNVLLLNDASMETEASDSKTLLLLILLRDVVDQKKEHLFITTEMRNTDNQRLAQAARVDDFVIGSNYICLLLAQLAENPYLLPLIEELLEEKGAELYMRPASEYVALDKDVNLYTVTKSVGEKNEVLVGYKLGPNKNKEEDRKKKKNSYQDVVVNPDKNTVLRFKDNDKLIVLATESYEQETKETEQQAPQVQVTE